MEDFELALSETIREIEEDPVGVLRKIAERQDLVYRNVPRCESCGHVQVQLVDINPPARWRCRVCRHKFAREP